MTQTYWVNFSIGVMIGFLIVILTWIVCEVCDWIARRRHNDPETKLRLYLKRLADAADARVRCRACKPYCCFFRCSSQAEWAIWNGPHYEDYTHSCTKHVGPLLIGCDECRVYALQPRAEAEVAA